MNRRRQRGFTLIELMVALVVSSLLVGMILAIFSRMSLAYRGQQQIAGVQQVLAAARATIELDAKQAGLEMAQGFTIGATGPGTLYSPVKVINSSTAPDQIAFFYADPATQAVVTSAGGWPGSASLSVDSVAGFARGDLVVMSNVTLTTTNPINPVADANLAVFTACVLQIDPSAGSLVSGPPSTMRFTAVAPWGSVNFAHCASATPGTMIYKFVARAYRIDMTRAALGALQQSPTGGLLNSGADNWTDLAYGFTDIQTALRVYDRDVTDADADGDATRDWYSGAMQDTLTTSATMLPSPAGLLQMSISLVARTDRDVEGIATGATPQLTVVGNANNNSLGDHASVALVSSTRIYRYTTFQVDFRNLGVGR